MHRTYSKFIYHGSKLHYSIYGEGDKVLFMFHGFGQTLKSLREIEETLKYDYKIYNFDLFFHGFSEWNHDDSQLSYDFWERMIQAFLDENGIHGFDLLGFSLGAKVCLATAELFPDKIKQMYLIAPDGIKRSFVYNWSTLRPFKGIFRNLILQPQLFYSLVRFSDFFKLLDKSVLRFASIQMNSREKRRRLYYTWTVYKGLRPNIGELIRKLNERAISTNVFVGKYDRLIPLKHIQPVLNRLDKVTVNLLNAGHNNLLDAVSAHMEKEIAKR